MSRHVRFQMFLGLAEASQIVVPVAAKADPASPQIITGSVRSMVASARLKGESRPVEVSSIATVH